MSSIQVWTSDGKWSKTVQGLDKLHFMRVAIIRECYSIYEKCDYKWDLYINSVEEISLDGISIDGESVKASHVIEENWEVRLDKLREILSKAKIFQMRLATLSKLANEDECLSAVYKKFIEYAKVPSEATDDYGLLFRFSAETYCFKCKCSRGGYTCSPIVC